MRTLLMKTTVAGVTALSTALTFAATPLMYTAMALMWITKTILAAGVLLLTTFSSGTTVTTAGGETSFNSIRSLSRGRYGGMLTVIIIVAVTSKPGPQSGEGPMDVGLVTTSMISKTSSDLSPGTLND